MLCDIDELCVAYAEARVARDRIARQLPDGIVLDTPEQSLLLHRMNGAFAQLSRAILDMRLALNEFGTSQIVVNITPERQR
ncbi:hypothetical protein P0F65_13665 [Sphingomonas sp. I4]